LFIKNEAKRLGFIGCGISKAGFLDHEAPKLEQWLKNGYHGQMQYMENYFDKRLDPRLLVEGAKSVVSLLFNYYPEQKQTEDTFKIAKYAYGEDYHYVVKDKLKTLMHLIEENIGAVNGRVFVDSAPVLEKAWAVKSGLGWMGKHTNVLTKKTGSFYFLAELILDLDLIVDAPTTDHCGTCTACIDACPTEAIIAPYVLDASKCISYLTIELKENIPQHFKNQMDDWAFGCDVCQDVCPWNSFAKPHQEDRFKPQNNLLNFSKKEWTELTQEVFKKVFKKSAVNRTKFVGLKRNIEFLG
jgi:epoxyqueuosine reductase